MELKEIKKKARKYRRKCIIEWYKYFKNEVDKDHNLESGVTIGLNLMFMYNYGQKQGARLLCFKNKNLIIKPILMNVNGREVPHPWLSKIIYL
jgi:hypothetical protein